MLVHASPNMQPNDELFTKYVCGNDAAMGDFNLTYGFYSSRAFPILIQQLMTTDDHGLLNEGTSCLSAYVARAPGILLQWYAIGVAIELDRLIA